VVCVVVGILVDIFSLSTYYFMFVVSLLRRNVVSDRGRGCGLSISVSSWIVVFLLSCEMEEW